MAKKSELSSGQRLLMLVFGEDEVRKVDDKKLWNDIEEFFSEKSPRGDWLIGEKWSERLFKVLKLRCGEVDGHVWTIKEIAGTIQRFDDSGNISPARVQQSLDKACRILRRPRRVKRLASYLLGKSI